MKKNNVCKLVMLMYATMICSSLSLGAQEVTSSGAFSYTYPLNIPPGRNGMAFLNAMKSGMNVPLELNVVRLAPRMNASQSLNPLREVDG